MKKSEQEIKTPLNSNNNNFKASEELQIESDSKFSSDEMQVLSNPLSNNNGQQKSTLNSNNNNFIAPKELQIESDSEFSSDEIQVPSNPLSNNNGQQKSTLNSNNNNNNNFITSSEQENSYQPKASNNFKLDTKVGLDALTSAMLLNEHIGDWLFENKSITHATEFAIAGTATVGGYVYGINPLDASLPVVRATAYTAKDIAHSRKASTIDAIKTYVNVEGHEVEVGLLVDIAFSAAIAYASPVFGMTFLLFGASSLINYLEENVSANSYSNIASNAISKGTGVVAALTHMACNKNMVTQHSEHPIYNAVGYFLATNYAYQVSDKVTIVGQSYTNMTPEFLVETMDYIGNTLDSYGL